MAAYQPTFPLGTLWVYQQPSLAGTVFLYTEMILSEFTNLTNLINLPQGYSLAGFEEATRLGTVSDLRQDPKSAADRSGEGG